MDRTTISVILSGQIVKFAYKHLANFPMEEKRSILMKAKDLQLRHKAEREFHNKRFCSDTDRSPYHTGFKSVIFDRMLELMGDIEGKRVAEIGCGTGWLTRILARKKAEVYSFDISEEAIKKVLSMLNKFNLGDRVHLDRMAAEHLNYESDFFDIVVGNAILHHLDLEMSANEIWRVMKKGGKAFFMEPLGHNPILNIYRKLTPHLRSKDEQPLLFNQLNIYRNKFTSFVHEEYFLVSFLALFWYFLRCDRLVQKTRDLFLPIDSALLSLLPGIEKYCWYSLLVLGK
jgi:ubiquinone/menaquinone biosynthesis C-methylase UbiE